MVQVCTGALPGARVNYITVPPRGGRYGNIVGGEGGQHNITNMMHHVRYVVVEASRPCYCQAD